MQNGRMWRCYREHIGRDERKVDAQIRIDAVVIAQEEGRGLRTKTTHNPSSILLSLVCGETARER
jgi:hypothetical protein